jgi:hypothetical protein
VTPAAVGAASAFAAPPWLWIPITIGAALAQNLRTAVQRRLKGRLSTNGANYTRFVFGVPLAVPNVRFASAVALGGVAQILGTSALLEATARRNFGISAVAFRGASLALAHPSYLMSAATTLLGARAL